MTRKEAVQRLRDQGLWAEYAEAVVASAERGGYERICYGSTHMVRCIDGEFTVRSSPITRAPFRGELS